MAIGDKIVGIDIGTSKVSTVVGEVNNFNQIEIICNTNAKCLGIEKGIIVNEDELSESILKSINDAEEISGLKINSAYITVPGKYVTIVQNSIIRETKDKLAGIGLKDVLDAIRQARDVEIPEDKVLADVIPDKFILDDGKVVNDPIGRFSSTLTLMAQIILIDKDYRKKITSVCRKAGIEIDGIVPITLAEKNLVLDANEQKDNVMILDIGAGNTEIGVFQNSTFIYNNTINLGGDNITSDIAYCLNISRGEAEKLKKQYGLALKSYIDNDNNISLNTCKDPDGKNKTIKSSELIEIIEARIEEIFTFVNKDIMANGIKNSINTVVLTGDGIVNISKSDMAGKIILNIPVKISTGRLIGTVKSTYRTSYALVRYVAAKPFVDSVASNTDLKKENHFFKNVFEKIKEFFYS